MSQNASLSLGSGPFATYAHEPPAEDTFVAERFGHTKLSAIVRKPETGLNEVAAEKLSRLGVHIQRRDGVICGLIRVEPQNFVPLPGCTIKRRQHFRLESIDSFRIHRSSPLHQLGPIPFFEARALTDLQRTIEARWWALAEESERALARAHRFCASATIEVSPWRIQGAMSFEGHSLQLLFSPRGERACISAIDQRPVLTSSEVNYPSFKTGEPLPLEQLKLALGKARQYSNSEEQVPLEQAQQSIDLLFRDLELQENEMLESVA